MYAIIDIETGGFSRTKNAICEIACIIVDEDFNILEELQAIIAPYTRRPEVAEEEGQLCSYKEDAMAIHGITMEEIENGVSAEVFGNNLQEALENHNVECIVGHNVKSFDRPWTEEFLDRFGGSFKFKEAFCTMNESKKNLNLEDYKLKTCCDHFGIVIEEAHRAMGDSKATFELFKKLK